MTFSHSVLPLVTLLICAVILRTAQRQSRSNLTKQRLLAARARPTHEEVLELVKKYGFNNNSFLTLYDGFQYFTSEDPALEGAIAYMESAGAWVGAAEPLTSAENKVKLLHEFVQVAMASGKAVVLLPVSESLAQDAKKIGLNAIMIGSDPVFKLDQYPPTGHEWKTIVPAAKRLATRGALVREMRADEIKAEERQRMDEITAVWLGSRKMASLGFLNKVEPWMLAQEKKYFSVSLNGELLAFIAAIPVFARQGWYFIDVMRQSDTPAGTTALLILEAMRLLQTEGFKEVTLGVAPLSNVDPTLDAQKQSLYRLLQYMYKKGNFFYNFQSLHQFKMKFLPTLSEKVFLIHYPSRFGLSHALGLFYVFMPGGLHQALWSRAVRLFAGENLAGLIKGQLSKSIAVRAAPQTLPRLLWRCKLTTLLAFINLMIFFFANKQGGRINPALAERFSFSWYSLRPLNLGQFLVSPFLHNNLLHLDFNLITLILFAGGLEYLTGTAIMAWCFFLPMLFANTLTLFIFQYPVKFWNEKLWSILIQETDIGISLGIFGCAGALANFLKHRKTFTVGLFIYSVGASLLLHDALLDNHLVAYGMGFVILRAYLAWF